MNDDAILMFVIAAGLSVLHWIIYGEDDETDT